jgi:hypothetical protein
MLCFDPACRRTSAAAERREQGGQGQHHPGLWRADAVAGDPAERRICAVVRRARRLAERREGPAWHGGPVSVTTPGAGAAVVGGRRPRRRSGASGAGGAGIVRLARWRSGELQGEHRFNPATNERDNGAGGCNCVAVRRARKRRND